MNTTIYKKMVEYKEYNGAKKACFTAKEWGEELKMNITSQRLTSMYKAGLVDRWKDYRYFKDNNYRYDVKK